MSAIILRTGVPIPPPAGPIRNRYCLGEGLEALSVGKRAYGQALSALGAMLPGGLSRLPQPIPLHYRFASSRVEIGRARVRLWFKQRRILDSLNSRAGGLYLGSDWEQAEKQARAALQGCVNAFNWLEDLLWDIPEDGYIDVDTYRGLVENNPLLTLGRLVEEAHAWAHRTGELVGGIFGCHMNNKNNQWEDNCILSLMHVRLGNSAGMTANSVCNACGISCWECDHEPGEMAAVTATRDENVCNICHAPSDCGHLEGASYDVRVQPVIKELDLHEVSLVPRPRDPLARITGRSVDDNELRDFFGFIPSPDARLLCHQCMFPCEGFRAGRYGDVSIPDAATQ